MRPAIPGHAGVLRVGDLEGPADKRVAYASVTWLSVEARCSCGCRRKVEFRDRRANARARIARNLVEKMEALDFEADDDEYRRAFLFEGVSWRNQYTRVVHGELTRDQIRSDDAWKNWKSGARIAVRQER